MKYFVLFFGIQLFSSVCFAQESAHRYIVSDQGSSITFEIKNLGFAVKGTVGGLQGTVIFHPGDAVKDSFEVSVDAGTINTDNETRDNHLKKEDYFDVQNYPRIRFAATSIVSSGKSGAYVITGKLTIKNTTKDLSFPFIAAAMGQDYIFSGTFKIDRKDFNIGGTSTLSNGVTVSLTVLAKKE